MSDEIWKDVPGYSGLYQASSAGRVRSMARATTSGKVLTPVLNRNGYLRVSISISRRSKYDYVHRLIALTFIGNRPDKYDVNHKNGIKTDNRAENLEYMTRAENMKHAREHGLHDNRGEKQWNAKLTPEIVMQLRIADSECGILDEVLRVSEINRRTILDVVERKTWRHLP